MTTWRIPSALDPALEVSAVDGIAIAEEVSGAGLVRERVDDLLGGPRGRGLVGDADVDEFSAVVAEYHEAEEEAKGQGRYDEEVDGRDVVTVSSQEGPPGRRRVRGSAAHILGDDEGRRHHRSKNSKARLLPPTFPPCPLPQATIVPPEGPSQAPGKGDSRRRCSEGRRSVERRALVEKKPERPEPGTKAWRRAPARGPDAARECRDEWLVRLRSPSRRRARWLCGWRGDHEAEPLEQDPQALAAGLDPDGSPPAAAARALKDVQAKTRFRQRRPHGDASLCEAQRPGRQLRPRPRPLASPRRRGALIDSPRGAAE